MQKCVFCSIFVSFMLVSVLWVDAATLSIDPANQDSPPRGQMITIDIRVADVTDLGGYGFDLVFDPTALKYIAIEEGEFLKANGTTTLFLPKVDESSNGILKIANLRFGFPVPAGVDGSGRLVSITFEVSVVKSSGLAFQNVKLQKPDLSLIDVNMVNGSIVVPTTIYNITATSGPNGSISPIGNLEVDEGDNRTFIITPDACYHITDVVVDGVSVGIRDTYSFSNVTSDHTIHATFEIDTYTITAIAGVGGSISPSGLTQVNCGGNLALMIKPDDGYEIDDVLVDGISVISSVTNDQYGFTDIRSDHTIHATFGVIESNDPPVVHNIPNIIFPEDQSDSSIDLDDYVSDPDNPDHEIIWSYSGNANVKVSINVSTHRVMFTTAENWNGSEIITFTATDPDDLRDVDHITVTVNPVNDPPVLDPIGNKWVSEGSRVVFAISASDADTGDELTYSADHIPPDASWDSVNREFTWTPDYDIVAAAEQSREFSITFSVTDSQRASDQETIIITVMSQKVDAAKPQPATNIIAESQPDGYIKIIWTPSVSRNAAIYNIYWDNAQLNIDYSELLVQVSSPGVSWTSGKLQDGVVYRFTVRCQDEAGNEEENTDFVSALADSTPPGPPTGLSSSTHQVNVWDNQSRVTVTWTPARDGNGTGLDGYSLIWDESIGTLPDKVIDIGNVTSVTATLTGIQYLHIRSADKAGNWSNTALNLGPFLIDTEPPQAPTNLKASSLADRTIKLSWGASGSADVVKYNIYWDSGTGQEVDYSQPITSVSANYTWLSNPLEHGKTYQFSVRAEDRAANEDSNTNLAAASVLSERQSAEPLGKQLGQWGSIKKTVLFQNYPNPFNPDTWIPYQLADSTNVTIHIYTIDGRLVKALNLGHKQAGYYTKKQNAVYWDGTNEGGEKVASGVYYYSIQAGDSLAVRKLILME